MLVRELLSQIMLLVIIFVLFVIWWILRSGLIVLFAHRYDVAADINSKTINIIII